MSTILFVDRDSHRRPLVALCKVSEYVCSISDAVDVVFDMSEIKFMASAGWWVLIDTQKTCKQPARGELILANVDKGIIDSLKIVGMDSYFKTYDDLTAAVGSF